MKILLLGSSGLLGKSIYKSLQFSKNISIFHNGLIKRKIDLLNSKLLREILKKTQPDLIINSAAVTNIEYCEKNRKISEKINVGIVKEIFEIKKKLKLNFLFFQFSTDQLYDSLKIIKNKESIKPIINNEYSKQKAKVEKICIKNNALVLRINFFGKSSNKDPSFTDWIHYSFKKKGKINLFWDVNFNPLSIDSLCKIIKKIILSKKFNHHGIYNVGSRTFMSKSSFAIEFAKKTGVYNNDFSLVEVNKFLRVKRSKNMVMNINKFQNKFNLTLPTLKKELTRETKKYIRC